MRHDYYQYDATQLLQNPKIPLEIMPEAKDVFMKMADEMIDIIQANPKQCVLILPVGPIGQYPYFISRVNEENISLKHCWFINMDEYLDDNMQYISMDHPLSFRAFMKLNVYNQIRPELNVPEEQRIFPDPNNTQRIPELITQLGGVDAVFGGIGINGHLAFNEANPELSIDEFLNLKTRVLEVSRETRTCNAIGDFNGALEDMPKYCITIGFSEIYHANKIILGVFRPWHKAVIRRAAYGDMTTNFPVSLLQGRTDVMIRLPESVAQL